MLKWVRSGKDIGLVATEVISNASEAVNSSLCSGEEHLSQQSISESDSNQMEVSQIVNGAAPEGSINGNGIIRSLSEFRSSDFCDWNSETVSV